MPFKNDELIHFYYKKNSSLRKAIRDCPIHPKNPVLHCFLKDVKKNYSLKIAHHTKSCISLITNDL